MKKPGSILRSSPGRRDPNIVRKLKLDRSDKAASPYFQVPFDVPAGTTRIEVRYAYEKSEDCVIDLGVGDSRLVDFPSEKGLRGWSGGARDWFFIGCDAATPGYQPGEIQSGTWWVLLGLYRLPADPVEVAIEIGFSDEERGFFHAPFRPAPARRAPGWYCGDLHCHTFHSDAKGAPQQLHETARREGVNFLAVTDHNTTTQQAAYFDQASSPDLVFVQAYEFTTERGHANIFGAREVFDFRVSSDADVLAMVRRIRNSGALFSINHDKPTIPWQYPVPQIDCMEVWQSHWLAGNFVSLARYQARLAEGRRITALGSSDFHQPAGEPANNPFTLARPCTWLWLEELSADGIIEAMRAGRSFVSESPSGPAVTLAIGEAGPGDALPPGDHDLFVAVGGAGGDRLHVWDATGCTKDLEVRSDDWQHVERLVAPAAFVRVEIVADDPRQRIVADLFAYLGDRRPGHSEWDDMLNHPIRRALTSPIYIAS